LDTAFATKADQSSLDTLSGSVSGLSSFVTEIDGRVDTLETDLGTAETNITNLQSNKEDAANKVTDFTDPNDTDFPTTLAVDTKIDAEIVAQVPLYNTNQFGEDVDLKTSLKTPAITPVSTSVLNFRSALTPYGTFANPIIEDFTFDLTNAKNYAKTVVNIVLTSIPTSIANLETSEGGTPIIFDGDSFSTTSTNINHLEFTYIDEAVIYCTNKVYVGFAPTSLNPNLFVWLDYNDSGKDLPSDPTLINQSIHSPNYVCSIINASDAFSVDKGGGNRAMVTANNASGSLRARHQMNVDATGISNWNSSNGITVISKFSLDALFSYVAVASNQDESGTSGFRFTVSSLGQLRTRIQDVNINSVSAGIVTAGEEIWLAMSYHDGVLNTYRMSPDGTTIPFEEVSNEVIDLTGKTVAMTSTIWFERNNAGSTTALTNKENDDVKIFNEKLSSSAIQALMTV
jgi:hypothetical protein